MNIGVVVGRFQIDDPHAGHFHLLDHVNESNDFMIVLLGTGPLPTTNRKPLPFHTRKEILKRYYPNATFAEIHDNRDDGVWSHNLDQTIRIIVETQLHLNYSQTSVRLYGGRDSFSDSYDGELEVYEIPTVDIGLSSTMRREEIIAKHPLGTQDFARGVIWANENKFPTVYSAVDGAVVAESKLLLITKKNAQGWLFPGGFTEPESISDERDIGREVLEECGIGLPDNRWKYVGSRTVDDWRYNSEKDAIRSRLFYAELTNAFPPQAGDDADTAQWVSLSQLSVSDFNQCHQPLFEMLQKKVTLR